MSYTDRRKKYEELYKLRNLPMIVYVTSIRPNMGCSMASDSITQIIDQVNLISDDVTEVDFLIVSNGGDPITALRIMSLLRERFKKINVLLPYVAYSAATILSLGADEIVMHPFSNLGPVDPQLTVSHNNEHGVPEHLQFSSEDLRNYVDFIRTDVGITDQQHLMSAISPLIKDVGSLPIGSAKRSQQLSLTLSEKMLSWHVNDITKAKDIAKALNSSYYHHGYAVGRTEAKDIGLNVVEPDKEIEKLLWEIWKDFENEMQCDKPFDVLGEIMNNPDIAQKISKVPVVDLPANTPPDVARKIISEYAQQVPVTTRSSLKQKVLLASIESIDSAKAVYNNIDIIYWRDSSNALKFNFTLFSSGWINYQERGDMQQ